MEFQKFTYPFRYVPHPEVEACAMQLIARIDESLDSCLLKKLKEGKMLGVLVTDGGPLYAFSGLVGGKSVVDGFVPPIYDLTDPEGYFKTRERQISAMPDGPRKAAASAELQDWLFGQYVVLNALGERRSVKEIFAARGMTPPGGTGDCAAPKLLQYAYLNGLKPLAMGEFWYGASPAGEVREHGRFYPSCTGKCGPLLTFMMEGLDVEPNPLDKKFECNGQIRVIYEDDSILVVDKAAGLLSVPGRTQSDSLLLRLRAMFGESVESCHRLDMDASGLMVFARTSSAKVEMERQFAAGEVVKTYRARLVAGNTPFTRSGKGTIALPLGADYYDRPRQMVDIEHGKPAITEYEVMEILPNGEVEVLFHPRTGRTHQLRVHSAHVRGLGRPIKGDSLYGSPSESGLFLRAISLSFVHPVKGTRVSFSVE